MTSPAPNARAIRRQRLTTGVRLLAAVVAIGSLGLSIGIIPWEGCYHQADIFKVWGSMALFALVPVGLLAARLARPGRRHLAAALPLAAIALGTYLWLIQGTTANRCPGYQATPSPSAPLVATRQNWITTSAKLE